MKLKTAFVLTLVLLIYLLIGAAIFRATELTNEQQAHKTLEFLFQEFVRNFNCVDADALHGFMKAVDDTNSGGRRGCLVNANTTLPLWDFPGAFTFAITVVTTIGYGHVYPATSLGRAICVFYALLGIPLTLIVLGGIGEQLNKIAQRVTEKLKPCACTPTATKALNCVLVFVSGLVLLFICPSLVFWAVEGWHVLEGLYYCFITLSTIGFGDYIAGQTSQIEDVTLQSLYRIGVYLWILVGLAYLSLVIKFISKTFISKAGQVHREAKKRVGSQRLSISDRRRRAQGETGRNTSTRSSTSTDFSEGPSDKYGGSRPEDISLEPDRDVHLVKISTVQLRF